MASHTANSPAAFPGSRCCRWLITVMILILWPHLAWPQDQAPQKRLRVLLFADGPTREFQFVRTLLAREQEAGRAELFVYAKRIDGEGENDRGQVLKSFPEKLSPDLPGKRGTNLSDFDLIIAFDPDWTSLREYQHKLLEQWVSKHGGGLIFVAGPVNTYRLSTLINRKAPLQTMLPVQLDDVRIRPPHNDSRRPYSLNFTPASKAADFLKLDGSDALSGWQRFFWGTDGKPAKEREPQRGFFTYYPIEKIRPTATVLASFAGPRESRLQDGQEHPFLVTMPYGSGRTFFIGSGETWRLRTYKESCHERFWLQLARHMSGAGQPRKAARILIIDGEGAQGRDKESGKGDSFFLAAAIDSITARPFEVVFGDALAGKAAVKALERDDLAKYAVIVLLNVRDLRARQLANLEKFAQAGGGVAIFLGPHTSSSQYNDSLFKKGKGLMPVPIEDSFYPPRDFPPLKAEYTGREMVLLRDDLFAGMDRYPVFGPIFKDRNLREFLKEVPIKRYFKVPRGQWQPDQVNTFELLTLPNDQPATAYQKPMLKVFYSQSVKGILDDPVFKKYRPSLVRHRNGIAIHVAPTSMSKAPELAQAIENLLLDRGRAREPDDYPDLAEFWASKDARVKALRGDANRLMNQTRYGDPLVVARTFGKGKVLAVMTTAGREWNDWAGGSLGSVIYPAFVGESLKYLSK